MTKRSVARLAASLVGLAAATLALSLGPGTASATASPLRPWRLVALGDSIPFGGRYCGGCVAYPSLLAAKLARSSGHRVSVMNLGVPGLTTAELLATVRGHADVREAIASADIVTITIGHNDTPWNSLDDSCDGSRAYFGPYRNALWATYTGPCLTTDADALRALLGSVLATIHSLRAGRPTLIEVTTDWNQVIGQTGITAQARRATKAVLDRFASATCAAARSAGARCGDVYHAFNGPDGTRSAGTLLAPDHDHASQRGHQAIATVLANFGYGPLTR